MTSSPWPLAAVLPAEPDHFVASLNRAVALGFTHVEVTALTDRPAIHLDALADAGAMVASATLLGDLTVAAIQQRRDTLRHMERQIADAARLGATCAVLTRGTGHELYFTEGCARLAAYAAQRMVRLAVRLTSGTCLSNVPAALSWLKSLEQANVGLALSIEGEPSEVHHAGNRLFHVYLRDTTIPASWTEALLAIGYQGVVGVGVPALAG
jgi:sugar phosphate isomerase/epimerase